MVDKMMRMAGRDDDGLAKAIKTDAQGFLEAKIKGNNKIETLWSNQSSLDGEWVDLTDGFVLVGDQFKELMISWSADTVSGRTFTIEAIWSSSTGSTDRQTLTETVVVAKNNSLSAFKKVDVKRSHVKLRYKVDGGDHSRSVIQALWSVDSSPTVNVTSPEGTNSTVEISKMNVGLNRKQTISPGQYINPLEEYVLVTDYEFSERTTAWALYTYEMLRPTNNLENGTVEFVIEYSDTKGNYSSTTGGRLIFRQAVTLSQSDEPGKGLVVLPSTSSTQGSNVILAGEYFNVPMAKYMRITIKNNLTEPAIRFLPITIVQEGNFDVV